MKIDKTGRKIISIEINDLVYLSPVRQGSLRQIAAIFPCSTTTSSPSRIPSGKIKRAFVKIISCCRQSCLHRDGGSIEIVAAVVAIARRQDYLRHSTRLLWGGIKAILFEG